MGNVVEYKGIKAFHPGYYIADILEDMRISQAEFALRMGITVENLRQLMDGQRNISKESAKRLSALLGTSAEVWLRLQEKYDEKLIEIEKAKRSGA